MPETRAVAPQAESTPEAAWSIRIGQVLGIPIRIHLTFLLLLVWFGFAATSRGESAFRAVAYLLALFACVALHELGHATMALRFGVRTMDIVLYPIGGIARLETIPQGWPELFIALAGPAVNVVLAAVFAGLLLGLNQPLLPLAPIDLAGSNILQQLLAANVMLFVFNLIPAFPMDGGRVLRAALTLRMPPDRATRIAATIGQGIAVLGGLAGVLLGNFVLVFIAVFVFLGAGQEALFFEHRAAVVGHTARDAMITRFDVLAPNDSLEKAAQLLLATHQHDFPVVDAWQRVAGVLSRTALMQGLATVGPGGAVLQTMNREWRRIDPSASLEDVLRAFQTDPRSPLLLLEGDQLIGMITFENLAEFLEIARVRRGG
jgi:stage IV sporulation protein FB